MEPKYSHQNEDYVPLKPLKNDEKDKGFWGKFRGAVGPRPGVQTLYTLFPIVQWIRKYSVRKNLLRDVVAGLTVGSLAVPQALGYAIVAGVAPIFGLYTSFIPPLIYTLMGTSRHVSVGVFALVCLMTGEVVGDIMERQKVRMEIFNGTQMDSVNLTIPASQVASTLAFAVGFWQLLLGLLGLGSLTVYLSDRVVQGFACGSACHIFNTQLKWVFGLSLQKRRGLFNLPFALWDFFMMLPYAHLATCLVSLACLSGLVTAKFLNGHEKVMAIIRFPIPMELFVIVFGSLTSYLLNLRTTYGVGIIQTVPLGLPTPQLPAFQILPEILADSFMIAVIAFSVAISAGRVFAQKHKYVVDGNQELRTLGIANVVGSFFQCFPSSVALARSAVQEAAGGVTQIVSIVSASLIVLIITVLGPLLEPAPKACLGCIVMVALGPMLFRFTEVFKIWKICKLEALIFLVPCVAIVILDVEVGLAIGVGFSLFAGVVLRTQMAKVQLLGRSLNKTAEPGTDGPDIRIVSSVPGMAIIRINAPLHFANAEICMGKAMNLLRSVRPSLVPYPKLKGGKSDALPSVKGTSEAMELHSLRLEGVTSDGNIEENLVLLVKEEPVKSVILDMVAVAFVDITGVRVLQKFGKDCLAEHGYQLAFSGCLDSVKEMLVSGGGSGDFPPSIFFNSICDAVTSLSMA